jgi:HK97 family phage portal protein
MNRRTASGKTLSDQRALQLSAVWSCIRVITESGANLPVQVVEKDSEGNREELKNDFPLAYLLKYSPNDYMTPLQWRTATWFQRTAYGNAYSRIDRSGERPVALHPMSAGSVEPFREGGVTKYRHKTEKEMTVYAREEVFHFMGLTSDGIVGLNPFAYARESAGIAVSADERAATSFGGVPNLVMKTDDWLKAEQREALKTIYDRLDEGEHTWILEGGVSAESLGLSPDDLQMLESRQFQLAEIARFYGVPVVMIDGAASAGASWPASYEKQVQAFLQFTLNPYLEGFESACINSLLTPTERRTRDIKVEFNFARLLRSDTAVRQSYYTSMVSNGIMTRNEIRALENLPPSEQEGADDLTVQLNMSRLEDLPDVSAGPGAPQPSQEDADAEEA